MAHFKKGMEVHIRDYSGQVDYRERYKIRSCGKKQAIVDYMRENSEGLTFHSTRGYTYYVTPIEEARARYGENIPDSVKTDWGQWFVLAGVDGWDAPEN